ncbi:hypothetical protein ABZS81_02320 [Streptomyces sp. NPDC005318]|uniref:hypothetical protein n=1 Tax=Streptomyces sp. NPDC005318 TaxID=3157031 RepID=UPI0033B5E973
MTVEIKTYWLSVNFDESFIDGSSQYGMDPESLALKYRADASLAHAEYRLSNHSVKYDRIDGILALKRAMQTRLEHLDKIYGLRQYPQSKAGGWLAVLESWGVIRRRMLQRMNRLRNAVEHDGAEPPEKEECEDYCEVVWWFLRATTSLLTPFEDLSLVLRSDEFCSLKLQFNPVRIGLHAYMLPENISDSELPGWRKIETTLKNTPPGRDRYFFQPLPSGTSEFEAKISDPVVAEVFVKASLAHLM